MTSDATNDFPVRLGSMLFTLVEPHEGHAAAYNRWYERDHFYAGCLVGTYNFAGGRFVATRSLRTLRRPQDSTVTGGDPQRGSYLAMYWILDGHHDDWTRWGGTEVHRLHEAGRMFPQRDHVHTKLYQFDWAAGRDDDPVPIELALDHPFAGLAVVIGEAGEGVDAADVDRWYRDEYLPEALPGNGAAVVGKFSLLPMPSDAPGVPVEEGSDRRFLHLYFLDDEPAAAWEGLFDELPDRLAASGLGRVVFSSPFLPTVPGTDTYVDDI